ncbi:hypothetical protein NLX83_40715 [Allokutzneria sp. A3M-2-11 16]|uniref:hypothetical protein n=1 Tax=Allokutzneria sp. A3M-2-11 16 TaxID=2962043 RepID=UPI0020B76CD6|nr:hypothetical protein [Allokutzneria sp. A3M-2-11 16]MCP3805605.1 hypothetical protein [Allokutzneria sp. A3M-2-11 16]
MNPAPMPPYSGPPTQPPPGTSFGRCVLSSLVWYGVVFVVLFATLGAPASGYAFGVVAGRLLFPFLLSALITWLFFRHKRTNFGILVLTSLPSFVVLSFAFGVLRMAGSA